jgi:hypothetical protein
VFSRIEAPLIVHYHIFKNAGSSVDAGLHAFFGDSWYNFEGAHAHDVQSTESLRRFIAACPMLRAVSSHLARPPLPYTNAIPIVFLRHPILRALSVYEFVRRNPDQFTHEQAREFFWRILTLGVCRWMRCRWRRGTQLSGCASVASLI